MANITFIHEDRTLVAEEGITLLEAARQAGLTVESPCNGKGICGKCMVIAGGDLSEPAGREARSIDGVRQERLSCQATVLGDVTVELVAGTSRLKTINRGHSIDVPRDCLIRRVSLPAPDKNSPVPISEGIHYRIHVPEVFQRLAEAEESRFSELFGITAGDELLDVAGYEKDLLGLAVDIGTTGISCYLVDLASGEICASYSSVNPQTRYGADVLTRISYCMENPEGTASLRQLIVDEINLALGTLTGSAWLSADIYHVTVAANTTMMHLFLGVDPTSLARSPYRAILLRPEGMKAALAGLEVNPAAILNVMPAASAYVGGDITAGLLASGFSDNERAVFIDIGTNGELVAVLNGRIICTSTAAGPALEGMNIECGCRAEPGAIEVFDIDEEMQVTFGTIDDETARGICGSGLIDIVAALVRRGLIDSSGRWNKTIAAPLAERMRGKHFYITEEVYISQKDIRQVQLAKGAIAAGMILMLKEIGAIMDDIPVVYIAGAFGYHIDPDNLRTIGLLPKDFHGEIRFLGNTSLEGARLALINRQILAEARRMTDRMDIVELSLREDFQKVFLSQLNF